MFFTFSTHHHASRIYPCRYVFIYSIAALPHGVPPSPSPFCKDSHEGGFQITQQMF